MILTDNQRAGLRLADWQARHMRLHGVTASGDKAWTDQEVEVLHAISHDRECLYAALPWRSRKAVDNKLGRCGLLPPRRVWQEGQWGTAKPLYRRGDSVREVIAPAVMKEPKQVWAKASKAGVRRPRRPPKDTPWPLVNEVRTQAFRLHLTMTDLDELAGTGSYFRRPKRLNYRAIKKAMSVMGGRFVLRWHDE